MSTSDETKPSGLPFAATELSRAYGRLGPLPVAVILDNVRSVYNVGAFFRTADAVGLDRLYLTGITAGPSHRGVAKTALGAETSVAWERAPHAADVVTKLRSSGVSIAAIETGTRAIDLFDWRPAFPLCVVFGHEVDGVAADIVDLCDAVIRIPMRGRKQSLNVATAGGVVLYELLRRYRVMTDSAP